RRGTRRRDGGPAAMGPGWRRRGRLPGPAVAAAACTRRGRHRGGVRTGDDARRAVDPAGRPDPGGGRRCGAVGLVRPRPGTRRAGAGRGPRRLHGRRRVQGRRRARFPAGACPMTLWGWILVASLAAYATKLSGYLVPARLLESPRMTRGAGTLTIGLLASLTAMNTFSAGQGLVVDARVLALLASGAVPGRGGRGRGDGGAGAACGHRPRGPPRPVHCRTDSIAGFPDHEATVTRHSLVHRLGRFVLAVLILLAAGWGALALWFQLPGATPVRLLAILAWCLLGVGAVAASVRR